MCDKDNKLRGTLKQIIEQKRLELDREWHRDGDYLLTDYITNTATLDDTTRLDVGSPSFVVHDGKQQHELMISVHHTFNKCVRLNTNKRVEVLMYFKITNGEVVFASSRTRPVYIDKLEEEVDIVFEDFSMVIQEINDNAVGYENASSEKKYAEFHCRAEYVPLAQCFKN